MTNAFIHINSGHFMSTYLDQSKQKPTATFYQTTRWTRLLVTTKAISKKVNHVTVTETSVCLHWGFCPWLLVSEPGRKPDCRWSPCHKPAGSHLLGSPVRQRNLEFITFRRNFFGNHECGLFVLIQATTRKLCTIVIWMGQWTPEWSRDFRHKDWSCWI